MGTQGSRGTMEGGYGISDKGTVYRNFHVKRRTLRRHNFTGTSRALGLDFEVLSGFVVIWG